MQQSRFARRLRPLGCILIVGAVPTCGNEDPVSPPRAGSLFIPANAPTVEGNSMHPAPFKATAGRFQTVYGATLLASLPSGARLIGMRFRLDESQTRFPAVTTSDLEIRLSTSQRPPGSLSTTFADNRGSDEVVARTGPLTIAPADYSIGSSPNAFGPVITFTQPFTYRGGALLLEVAHAAFPSSRGTDHVAPATGSQSGYGVANGFNSTTADLGMYADLIVVEYVFVRP